MGAILKREREKVGGGEGEMKERGERAKENEGAGRARQVGKRERWGGIG